MSRMPAHRYRPVTPVDLPDRRWPSRSIRRAPQWCSVDLRDGNQALIEPMGPDRKLRLFSELVAMGFKEIEVGFPSASTPDFDFVRQLIEEHLVPDDVTIQVLVPAREAFIQRTFEALRGAPNAIVHLYNSTSPLQRRLVFGLERAGVVDIAVGATRLIRAMAEDVPDSRIRLEYSPESFTATELDFSKEICEAVLETWGASPTRKVIVNLPSTVEIATPNHYADQIEWFDRHVRYRDSLVLSIHPHNDRGTAVASAELALLAGAERIEGTLFGNGERTGNVDVVTLALNMLTQGVDPELEIRDTRALKEVAEFCNRLPVHCRHPYTGDLVFTAFSGSHQDAIKKGMAAAKNSGSEIWEVPYLPIDPNDVGRSYDAVVRINSQSGKGGVAYVLEQVFGYQLPRPLQQEFSRRVQEIAEATATELTPSQIGSVFEREYLASSGPFEVVDVWSAPSTSDAQWHGTIVVRQAGTNHHLECSGTGPIDGFVRGLRRSFGVDVEVGHYSEHALAQGAAAEAVAYIQLVGRDGQKSYGVGRDSNIVLASFKAVVGAANRLSVSRAEADVRLRPAVLSSISA